MRFIEMTGEEFEQTTGIVTTEAHGPHMVEWLLHARGWGATGEQGDGWTIGFACNKFGPSDEEKGYIVGYLYRETPNESETSEGSSSAKIRIKIFTGEITYKQFKDVRDSEIKFGNDGEYLATHVARLFR